MRWLRERLGDQSTKQSVAPVAETRSRSVAAPEVRIFDSVYFGWNVASEEPVVGGKKVTIFNEGVTRKVMVNNSGEIVSDRFITGPDDDYAGSRL